MSARTRPAATKRRREALYKVFKLFAEQTGTTVAFAGWGYSHKVLFVTGPKRRRTLTVKSGHTIEELWSAYSALIRMRPSASVQRPFIVMAPTASPWAKAP